MITRRRFATIAAALLFGATLAVPLASLAADGAAPSVEVLVLFAKNDPKGGHIDPQAKIPQLSQAPFNTYNTYTFVADQTLKLETPKPGDPWKGKPSAVFPLANGKPLSVALLGTADKRFQMGAAIGKDSPDVARWTAPPGEPFFIAGQTYKDGILVVGITVRP